MREIEFRKEIFTNDGYKLTYSHSIKLDTLKGIEERLNNLEDLKMRGMLEPVGILYRNGYKTYYPYTLHIYSYAELGEAK